MAKHYKIVTGYEVDQYVPISGDELPRAWALFLEGNGRGVFEHGGVRGQDIKGIYPDWGAALGFNRGYKMTSEDYGQIRRIEKDYNAILTKGKDIAKFALEKNRPDLLAMPATQAIKELPAMKSLRELAGGAI